MNNAQFYFEDGSFELLYEYLDEYSPVPYTTYTCQHCGCTETVLGDRPPRFNLCRCCGIEHANQYRHYPSIVRSEFKAQAVGHD